MTGTRVQQIDFPDPEDRAPTILIVEDETLIRIALSDYLQECGFKVLEAAHGDEAVEILEHSPVTIDLVFSDVVMPGAMDGFALAHWVRIHRPELPIMLTSGDARKVECARELCEREPLLSKPYDLALLAAKLRAMLGTQSKDTA